MSKKTIAVFLDDREIFYKTLKEYKCEEKLSKANISFKYTDEFSNDIIQDFNIVFIFLDTCWNKKGDDSALLNQIELIKTAASTYPEKKLLVFPYSTTYRDINEFAKLYKQFGENPQNITLDKEPFLIRRNSAYQMNGIMAMISSKKSEIETNG